MKKKRLVQYEFGNKFETAAQRRKRKNWERNRNNYHIRKARNPERCDLCDGYMTWCSCCGMWSSDCCIPYGTCGCS